MKTVQSYSNCGHCCWFLSVHYSPTVFSLYTVTFDSVYSMAFGILLVALIITFLANTIVRFYLCYSVFTLKSCRLSIKF